MTPARSRERIAAASRTHPYKELVEKAGLSIVIDDIEGRFVYFNRSFAEIFGYTPAEMKGRSLCDIVHPDDADKVRRQHGERMEGRAGSTRYEFKGWTKTRQDVYLEVFAYPIREKGRIVGTQSYLWDVTARRKTELELERTLETLRTMTGGIINVVHRLVDLRDPYTGIHQRRTADLARAIAREMGLPADMVDGIRMAGLIHDIGKIAVPAEILSKPARLTAIEYDLMKTHAATGARILDSIDFPWPIARIVRQHHERLDGSGYPDGLSGDSILLEARILGVADVVEAMITDRPYRAALDIDEAIAEIEGRSGTLYDPNVVEACLRLFQAKGFRFNLSLPYTGTDALAL
ncbi:MAG: PAS domain S-box protein [Acidobacteriota bacterium]|nr:PAS domain S-box protein [Acidobacteriota bacterium]